MNGRLRVTGPSGQEHVFVLDLQMSESHIAIRLLYESGDLQIPRGTTVADWQADYEAAVPGIDAGYLDIGQGRRDILIDELRGIRLGSFLMSLIIQWALRQPSVPMAMIFLSAADARSAAACQRRNRFWEKLGVSFDYQDGGASGKSKPMMSHELIDPGMHLAEGWKIEECDHH